jgi:hypothetical protein
MLNIQQIRIGNYEELKYIADQDFLRRKLFIFDTIRLLFSYW